MTEIPSYGKVWQVGHGAVAGIFDEPVLVQEKVDGSQISFAKLDGEVYARSKGAPLDFSSADALFKPALETIKSLDLPEGIVFRGETLCRPKHNTITYDRVPNGNIVLFDSHTLGGQRVDATLLDLEWVPHFGWHTITSVDELKGFLERESFLGGSLIEGVVVKRYDAWDKFGSPLRAKYVSEAFKETHRKDWKDRNPNRADLIVTLTSEMRNTMRWEKAVQHLRDDGRLDNSPRDIGELIKEVRKDLTDEEQEYVKQRLFDHFWPTISRGATSGLPEWYKDRLAEAAFA